MQFDCAPAGVTLTRHMAGKPQRDADCRHQKVGQVRSRLSLQAAAGGPQGLRLETNRKRHLHPPPQYQTLLDARLTTQHHFIVRLLD